MKYEIRYYYDRKYEGYYGECYDEGKKRWYIITHRCLTRWGCKRAVIKYHKITNRKPLLIDEFEL